MFSMLDHMIEAGITSQRIRLLYGVNHLEDLFGVGKLRAYKAAFFDFDFEIAVVFPHPRWAGQLGYVTSLLRAEYLNEGNVDAYMCGPPPMIDMATSCLKQMGLTDGDIHSEKFFPSYA